MAIAASTRDTKRMTPGGLTPPGYPGHSQLHRLPHFLHFMTILADMRQSYHRTGVDPMGRQAWPARQPVAWVHGLARDRREGGLGGFCSELP